jgi:16S rRNA C967 or C1407 C5-methylase (RsmB/RsmF family)/NOL1/NOP2/fmu family ribosome biogenesis protein
MNSLDNLPGFNRESFFRVHESSVLPVSIRVNPQKLNRQVATGNSEPFNSPATGQSGQSEILRSAISPVPWSSFGYYLRERPAFTLDPLFHAGSYYVQEASSMFLEQVLTQTIDLSESIKILDLCAAPGGKSTLIQSIISEDSLLLSNEVIKSRVNIVVENMIKWGGKNVVVTNNDAKDFAELKNYFDAIVVDAPCSGSGLFRKDPKAISEWSEQNVALCSHRQKRILADVFPALKSNGILIYSTCSYSEEENEQILDWLHEELDVESIKLNINADWGIVESVSKGHSCYGYRFYPDQLKGEGFFIAAIRKTQNAENTIPYQKETVNRLSKQESEIVKIWLRNDTSVSIIKHEKDALAIPKSFDKDIPLLQKYLYLKQAGITVGKVMGDELIPDHALAMSDLLSPSIASISLNKEDALQYLRKADVFIDVGQRGWGLVQYCGINLGWIKHLGNRVNNYYPKDWRILMR